MRRSPYIHLLLAGLALFVALSVYGIWWSEVSSSSAEASQIRQEIRALGDTGGRTSSIRRALEELETQEAQLYRHFVGKDTIVQYLEEVETTAERLGASVEVVSVSDTEKSPRLNVSLRITGSFDAVMRTLGAIEYQQYDTTLASLTLDTPPLEDKSWTAAATFSVGKTPQPAASQ